MRYINCKTDVVNIKELSYTDAIDKINKLTQKSKFGTAVVVNNMDTYFNCVKVIKGISNYELFDIINACGENVIIFSPDSEVSFKDYQNIFFLDSYLCKGYINSVATKFNKIYSVNSQINMSLFSNLDCDRNTFAKIMNSIKANKSDKPVPDLITYFNNLRKYNFIDKNLKYNEFIFFMLTMEELGILKFNNGLIEHTDIKSKLESSSVYNFVNELLTIK